MTTIAIHQPEYFPWLGFFDKARQVDALVLLDTVQFDRSSLQHRTRVIGANGAFWMTIPFVHKFPQRIDEVVFSDTRWATKHWKALQAAYGRTPGFAHAAPALECFFTTRWSRLIDATEATVELLLDAFRARPVRLVRSSALRARGEKSELVLGICRELGASRYLSGRTGASYLDPASFAVDGIEIAVQSFALPDYRRSRPVRAEDLRGLSALDAWLSLGVDAPGLLAGEVSG